jgi:diguanylate cyclase (GGDEF)-like protein
MSEANPTARLLLVDDDRVVLEHISRALTELGHETLTAQSWTDAVRLFREKKPDLVLLDVVMPSVDGFKLARIIKSEARTFTPVIFLTALDDIEAKRRGLEAGADDFLSKPVTPLELEIRVRAMLRIKHLTDELGAARDRLQYLATTDDLTGLRTRRTILGDLDREFSRARRYGSPLSTLMIDVDSFKHVNDTYGHATGDQVLSIVGDSLRQTLRTSDLAGRLGGEEFVVLAPETRAGAAVVLAERLRKIISEATASRGGGVPRATVSIGLASTEHPESRTAQDLLRLSDEALYRAKREGRDRTVVAIATEGVA